MIAQGLGPDEARVSDVMRIFGRLSDFPRESLNEADLRRLIIEEFIPHAQKTSFKGRTIEHRQDATGNIVVIVPGTGRFSHLTQPVALQNHLDMVLDTTGGLTVEQLKKNGVDLVLEGREVHSREFKSTIGADARLSLAVALYYLFDTSIEHPPLEIVMTIDEENDSTGVNNFAIPLQARHMLNLDLPWEKQVCVGCMGSVSQKAESKFNYEAPFRRPIAANEKLYEFTLTGLRGGHSGQEGFAPRARIENLLMNLVYYSDDLAQAFPTLGWASVEFGSEDSNGSIPRELRLRVALPDDGHERFEQILMQSFRASISQASDENPDNLRLVKSAALDERPMVFANSSFQNMIYHLAQFRGYRMKDDAQYPGSLAMSQTLYYARTTAEDQDIKLGILIRSFEAGPMAQAKARLQESLGRAKFTLQPPTESTPWMLSDGSRGLVEIYRRVISADHPLIFGPGVLEAGDFTRHFPQMAILSIGLNIKEEHETTERFTLDTLGNFIKVLDRMLVGIGETQLPPE